MDLLLSKYFQLQELKTKHESVLAENEELKSKLQQHEIPAEEKEVEG